MAITSSEPEFRAEKSQTPARDLTEHTAELNCRRRHSAILDADRVAIIQTNLAASIGLKPKSISRFVA